MGYRYYASDFIDISGMGNNRTATCPKCGKEHISISMPKGIVKCFTPGCVFEAGEFCEGERPDDEPFGQKVDKKSKSMKESHVSADGDINPFETFVTSIEQVPVLESDYYGKTPSIKDGYKEITDDPEDKTNGMAQARRYFSDMGISVETAMRSHVIVGMHSFSTEETKHKNVEDKYEQLPVIAYITYVGDCMVAYKIRAISRKGDEYEKFFQMKKLFPDLPAPPFGLDGFCNCEANPEIGDRSDPQKTLIVCEGEKDCLSLREAGFWNAISISTGAGEDIRKSLSPFMHHFASCNEVIICGDNDQMGRFLQMRLEYVFQGRSRLVSIAREEGKDISDILRLQGVEAVREKIFAAYSMSECKTIRPLDIEDDVISALRGNSIESYPTGYGPLTDKHFRLTDRGGLIVVTGLPGDGKTDFLYDLAAHLITMHGKKFTFCSMEDPDVNEVFGDLIHRVLDRSDLSYMSDAQMIEEIANLNNYVACFNIHRGDPSAREIIRECDTQWNSFQPNFLVVDNYARLKREVKESQNETDFVRDLLSELQDWGLQHRVWVFIVAHPKKVEKLLGDETIKASDISGSAHWSNLADYVISIKRNYDYENSIDEKIVDVLKVRRQKVCAPGRIYYHRKSSGVHEEFK